MNVLKLFSRILSGVFSPMLMPTYGMIISLSATYMALASISLGSKLAVTAIIFGLTAFLPGAVIFLLMKLGKVSDFGLRERSQRMVPLAVAAVTYIAAGLYLMKVNSPVWMSDFMFGATAALITVLVVSFRWKISGHATGMGGLCAFLFMLYYKHFMITGSTALLVAAVVLAGAVCTSRLILERHTLAQVVAGFFNGALWLTLFEMI